MSQNPTVISLSEHRNPWLSLLILIVVIFSGAFVAEFLALLFMLPFVDMNFHEFTLSLGNWEFLPSERVPLLILQVFISAGAFIAAPLVYFYYFEKKNIKTFFQLKKKYAYPILLTICLVFSSMIVNTVLIQWNMAIKLPAFLEHFEKWAQAKETELKKMTTFLTTFSSPIELILAFFAVAIIPAIGEELLFRGVLQNLFHRITQHIHLAIFMSAFIFSAIHFQFYGLVPRFFLGVLFGYIYWWSKDIAFPIIAHFFNNAFTLTLLFFHHIGLIEQNIEEVEPPFLPIIYFFLVVGIIFSFILQRYFTQRYLQSNTLKVEK
ncbi:MAG: CPBP family intramembrane metalloprotease [Cytophagales bacterium]|nr:CPBP family intramembrane metalloprotease [Cytophagales bacterium]